MTDQSSHLPEFENPPVAEVSVAVTFEPLDRLTAFEIGEAWHQIFEDELPQSQEQPPLLPQVEQFGKFATQPQVQIQLLPGPPTPRFWFVDASGSNLVQIQRDWFARNWRRTSPDEPYPRFDAVRVPFKRDLERLATFIEEHKLGTFAPVQCEVTYINPIGLADHAQVTSILRYWHDVDGHFLKAPENIQANVRYLMTDDAGEPYGRLHVSVQPALRTTDDAPIYLLSLTARGKPTTQSITDVMNFVEDGHRWIVCGFADITTEEMHDLWGEVR